MAATALLAGSSACTGAGTGKYDPALFGTVHEELGRLWVKGDIDPLVSQALPLDQAPEALKALASRSTVGKVVLLP